MIKYKHKLKNHCQDQAGFTIIESLMAILVVSILLAAIAPAIVLSVATRVQSRRVELATQAAKTFIDGVKTGAITAPTVIGDTLSASTSAEPRTLEDNAEDYLVDASKMTAPSSTTDLYCMVKGVVQSSVSTCQDDDNKSNADSFLIQAGRLTQSTDAKDGYRLALRIYRADIDFSTTVKPTSEPNSDEKVVQNTFAAGLGDRQAPVIEISTDITNSSTTYQALCQRLGILADKSCQ